MTNDELYKECHRLFRYEDGKLIRKVDVGKKVRAGDIVGSTRKDGYVRVNIAGKFYNAHRLIFLMDEGWLPDKIDHIKGMSNRRENLRPATTSQNGMNRGSTKGSSSKYKCVSWNSARKAWIAAMKINGKKKYLGRFDNEDDAARAVNECIKLHHGEFACLNVID